MHSGAAISGGFFLGNLSKSNTSIKIGMNIPCGLLFWKKTLADQNVKMAAIYQDGRHFEYQNIRFFLIKPQIIVLFE